nr:MAG TPA: hypothetical protein [Caudoviricetes sp.]
MRLCKDFKNFYIRKGKVKENDVFMRISAILL